MPLNVPVFLTRLASSVVFVVIMLSGLLGPDWAFVALAALIQFLCLREYMPLMQKADDQLYIPKWVMPAMQAIAIAVLWLSFFFPSGMPALLCLPVLLLMVSTLGRRVSYVACFYAFAGLLYIALPTVLLVQLRLISAIIPLALILMIWTNDTMAYLVGSFVGRTPFSAISPKKTWEGTGGGAVLAVAGAATWGYFAQRQGWYRITDWVALGVIAAVAGTLGDLLKSRFKRVANVKDSGNIMPGHGGALDRFDSLIATAPLAFCYAWFFMPHKQVCFF
jgi:phosphatidate cytidylyltransferase